MTPHYSAQSSDGRKKRALKLGAALTLAVTLLTSAIAPAAPARTSAADRQGRTSCVRCQREGEGSARASW